MKTVLIGDKKIHDLQSHLGANTWPEFIQHDKIVNEYWPGLYADFLGFQFALMEDDKLLGIGNSIPLHWNQPFSDLPEGGLDWALEKANVDFRMTLDHNILVGVQILIDPRFQNQGLSYEMLDIMKGVAKKVGFTSIALPLRPSLKSKYPLIPMEDYIYWKNEEGLPFDPWIRVHIKAGGKIIKTCNKSMEIFGTIKEWEKWTNGQFQTSGDYIIEKALVPIRVNVEKNIGKYIEPNVWIVHTVK